MHVSFSFASCFACASFRLFALWNQNNDISICLVRHKRGRDVTEMQLRDRESLRGSQDSLPLGGVRTGDASSAVASSSGLFDTKSLSEDGGSIGICSEFAVVMWTGLFCMIQSASVLLVLLIFFPNKSIFVNFDQQSLYLDRSAPWNAVTSG